MKWEELELEPRITAAVRRVRLSSLSDVFSVSPLDLQRLTGLSRADVQQLIGAAAAACRTRPPVSALLLLRGQGGGLASSLRLSVGCPDLDQLLRGGLPVGGVTELSGQSGAGKTQLALQLCLCVQFPPQHGGLNSGAVYICTEDTFPMRRLHQLISEQPRLRTDAPPSLISSLRFTDHVYIEHAADLDSLSVCLSRRVPLLAARGLVSLVVVDSVAALFRAEFQADDWLKRNKEMMKLSSALTHLSVEFNTTVLCVNQVTDVFNPSNTQSPVMSLRLRPLAFLPVMSLRLRPLSFSPVMSLRLRPLSFSPVMSLRLRPLSFCPVMSLRLRPLSFSPVMSHVSPALGLAWANQLTVRLMMLRLQGVVTRGDQSSALRRLEVVFAPHLDRDGRDAAVWREGVTAVCV